MNDATESAESLEDEPLSLVQLRSTRAALVEHLEKCRRESTLRAQGVAANVEADTLTDTILADAQAAHLGVNALERCLMAVDELIVVAEDRELSEELADCEGDP